MLNPEVAHNTPVDPESAAAFLAAHPDPTVQLATRLLLSKLAEVQHDADHDPKTPELYNAAAFRERVEAITQQQRRKGDDSVTHHSLIVGDLDGLKRLNEELGYEGTDAVCILPVGSIFGGSLRPTDLAMRFGGDEFVAFLSGTDVIGALGVASRIQREVNKIPVIINEEGPAENLGMSMAIVPYEPGADYDEVFGRANQLLLDCKAAGKNMIFMPDGAMVGLATTPPPIEEN